MHGSNRLGGNSLSDLLVFGRRAGLGAADYVDALGGARPTVADDDVDAAAARGARAVRRASGGENPYTLHAELQQTMNDLVGIIRTRGRDARRRSTELEELKERVAQRQRRGRPAVQPGLAPGARPAQHAAGLASASPRPRWSAQESRGGHTRDDFPAMDADWRQINLVCRGRRRRRRRRWSRQQPVPMRAGPARAVRASTSWRSTCTDEELAELRAEGRALMGYNAQLPGLARRRRAAASCRTTRSRSTRARSSSTSSTGCRPPRPRDLAVRWNCKAGKCGSCSAEINGRPRLMCMTRMSTFDRGRDRSRSRRCAPSR